MLEKDQLGGGKVRVTFLMPTMEGVGTLSVCGEFNQWDVGATPMTRAADGTWSAAVTLEAGRSYQFRYRDDRGGWHNDPAADGYRPNDYGSENSVVDVPASAELVAPRPSASAEARPASRESKPAASAGPPANAKEGLPEPAAGKPSPVSDKKPASRKKASARKKPGAAKTAAKPTPKPPSGTSAAAKERGGRKAKGR